MMSFLLKFIAIISTLLLISGCGTTLIQANITTSVDPSFSPKTNMRIVVTPKDLDAVYYLPVVKEALEIRGFNSVSVSRSRNISSGNYEVSVMLDVNRNVSEETKTVNDYGVVGTKITPGDFKCKETNNGLTGKRTRCRSGETKIKNTYGKTGTREVTTTSLSRSISLSFSSLSNNQSVISAIGTSDEADYKCSNSGIYKFLIIHTIQALDFTEPRNTNYGISLPEGFSCENALEYERSKQRSIPVQKESSKPNLIHNGLEGDGECKFKICA
jgi:hypothetical protein